MMPVTIGVTVTDDSDPVPACEITNVMSSEPSGPSDWSLTGPRSAGCGCERLNTSANGQPNEGVGCIHAEPDPDCAYRSV